MTNPANVNTMRHENLDEYFKFLDGDRLPGIHVNEQKYLASLLTADEIDEMREDYDDRRRDREDAFAQLCASEILVPEPTPTPSVAVSTPNSTPGVNIRAVSSPVVRQTKAELVTEVVLDPAVTYALPASQLGYTRSNKVTAAKIKAALPGSVVDPFIPNDELHETMIRSRSLHAAHSLTDTYGRIMAEALFSARNGEPVYLPGNRVARIKSTPGKAFKTTRRKDYKEFLTAAHPGLYERCLVTKRISPSLHSYGAHKIATPLLDFKIYKSDDEDEIVKVLDQVKLLAQRQSNSDRQALAAMLEKNKEHASTIKAEIAKVDARMQAMMQTVPAFEGEPIRHFTFLDPERPGVIDTGAHIDLRPETVRDEFSSELLYENNSAIFKDVYEVTPIPEDQRGVTYSFRLHTVEPGSAFYEGNN